MKKVEKVIVSEEQINNKCIELADKISKDYENVEDIIAIGLLKGSVFFMTQLLKNLKFPILMDFMEVSSYDGVESTNKLIIKKDLNFDIKNKKILIIEDIVDTGFTLKNIISEFKNRGAESVEVCSLLSKPSRRLNNVDIKYLGFEIEDYFVVGYGMDYNEKYRNLPYIGVLAE